MSKKQMLNLNSNHKVDYSFIEQDSVIEVFTRNLSPDQYKNEEVLKKICCDKVKSLNLNKEEKVHLIYSGLAVVLTAFINALQSYGYKVIVMFEDKDNGGYYSLEVNKLCGQ